MSEIVPCLHFAGLNDARSLWRKQLNLKEDQDSFIYALKELRSNEARYVGQSANPQGRLKSHMADSTVGNLSKDNPRRQWIESAKSRNSAIVMIILEKCKSIHAHEREAHWYHKFLSLGYRLTNTHKPIRSVFSCRVQDGYHRRRSIYLRLLFANRRNLCSNPGVVDALAELPEEKISIVLPRVAHLFMRNKNEAIYELIEQLKNKAGSQG